MSGSTSIEWTEASWNPVRGCSLVSPGCTNCYAMREAHRHGHRLKEVEPGRWRRVAGPYHGLTRSTKGGPVWTGKVALHHELLDWPLRRRKPSRIFVNSMSDLFHEDVPDWFVGKVFDVMESVGAGRHTFQILTKRAERMMKFLQARWGRRDVPAAMRRNIWLGVSVEDQVRADERIPLLLQTPAAVRWISAEPLLGPMDLTRISLGKTPMRTSWCGDADQQFKAIEFTINVLNGARTLKWPGLNWAVVGGESGPSARPCDLAWMRSIIQQCQAAGVPIFVKQLGYRPIFHDGGGRTSEGLRDRKGGDPAEWPEDLRVREYPA